MRHTKIIATVGPATSGNEAIRGLIAAGVDIFRLNFSHGTHEGHAEVVERVRREASLAGRSIAILQDLGGPKIRTGLLHGGSLDLAAGDELRIAAGDFVGDRGRISTAYTDLARAVSPGDRLLLDDGHIQLRVEESDGSELRTVVVFGGRLGEHKGINAPGVPLPAAGLTPKDAVDLRVGVSLGVDLVALSFVQSVGDVRQAREALVSAGAQDMSLIAKLERPEAIEHLDEIIQVCDGVMVARGDLGLELPIEQVPRIQKEITRKARAAGVPVILATQVLESMHTEPRPTRAEVSDAANAVDDGVDAIMLAGETATGLYPLAAVQTLDAVIRETEAMPPGPPLIVGDLHLRASHARALCEATVTLAHHGDAAAIVAVTHAGKTARILSALRPRVPVYGATPNPDVARRLSLSWGVVPLEIAIGSELEGAAAKIGALLVERGAVPVGGVIAVVSVNADLRKGGANFLKLLRV